MIQQIKLIELDDSLQLARVKTHEEKIDQYAEYFMERNDWGDFPPIDVVLKDGRFQIADGIHRFRAAKRAGFETAPCIVTDGGDDDWTLLEKSVEKNGVQGIDMDFKDWEQFRRLTLTKLSRGEIHNRPLSDIAKLGHCHPSTITRMRDKMKAEGWTFPETAVGADGKEYPTQKKKSVFARAKTETEPSAPPSFCANGCGTPIWEANKADPNYTYVEEGGKLFCSPECAEAYKGKELSDAAEELTGIPEKMPPDLNSLPVCDIEEPGLDSLPICEDDEPDADAIVLECIVQIRVPGTKDPKEAFEKIQKQLPQVVNTCSKFQIDSASIYINNLNLNDLNNITNSQNSDTFTGLSTRVLHKKKVSRKYITKAKLEEWKSEFGEKINVEQCLKEWCKYWDDRRGDAILKADYFWTCAKKYLKEQSKEANEPRTRKGPYRDESSLTSQEGY